MAARTDADLLSRADAILVGAMLCACVVALGSTFADPDMFHVLSLGRETLARGALPMEDPFAYTPTRVPVVHHEWLLGLVHYPLVMAAGGTGLLVLKYLLHGVTVAVAIAVARRSGASMVGVAFFAPIGLVLLSPGMTTLRAQAYTLWFVAMTLCFIHMDRGGARGWMLPFAVMYVVWLNCHGGFVVGLVLLAAYAVEQALRGAPWRHVACFIPALLLLVLVTPYGLAYPVYLWEAVPMDRSLITEWGRTQSPLSIAFLLFSLLLFAAGLLGAGGRNCGGWLLVALSAAGAYLHQRHVSIYGVVWLACVPPLVEQGRVGLALRRVWAAHPWGRRIVLAGAVVFATAQAVRERAWEVAVPTQPGYPVRYPVGVVEFLETHRQGGNMVTPFEVGAFVSWKLFPAIKVSLDGRYEAAYDPALLVEHQAFYDAAPSWPEFLDKYPPDLVLAREDAPVVVRLRDTDDWRSVYEDDAFVLFARAGTDLARVDRRGEVIVGTFP